MTRSTRYAIAAIIQLVLSVFGLVGAIIILRDSPADAPPFFILVNNIITGVVGIVCTYGVWRGQKWAIILTILVCAVDGLIALPGAAFAPSMVAKIGSMTDVILRPTIIVLLLWRDRKAILD